MPPEDIRKPSGFPIFSGVLKASSDMKPVMCSVGQYFKYFFLKLGQPWSLKVQLSQSCNKFPSGDLSFGVRSHER